MRITEIVRFVASATLMMTACLASDGFPDTYLCEFVKHNKKKVPHSEFYQGNSFYESIEVMVVESSSKMQTHKYIEIILGKSKIWQSNIKEGSRCTFVVMSHSPGQLNIEMLWERNLPSFKWNPSYRGWKTGPVKTLHGQAKHEEANSIIESLESDEAKE